VMDMAQIQVFTLVACSACGFEFKARSRVGRFQILEQLAKGGTASVYRAVDSDSGAEVALKIMDPDAMEQHLSQARRIAALHHPNIVQIFDFGESQGLFFLSMEFLGGGSLDDWIFQRGRVDEAFALEVGIQVVEGLSAAWGSGLLHRDIKPANLLFGTPTRVKLVDFGLSAQPIGEVWGTPDYIAPEKLAEFPEDFRSDFYSLGSTLFHALAGHPPYKTNGVSLAALRELKKHPVDLREATSGLHQETTLLVQRMMSPDPASRPGSHDALISELREVLEKVQPAAH